MRAAAIALLFALGFLAGWAWRGDRCEAQAASTAAVAATARETSITAARATEAAQNTLARKADDAYQNYLARLVARPVPRRSSPVRSLRQPDAATPSGGVPAPAQDAAVADAVATDPVPDPGCASLERDAQKTTLMLVSLQQLLRAEGMGDD